MYSVRWEIEGVSPLLQNRWGEKAAEDVDATVKGREKDTRPPEDRARDKLYIDGDGHFCHPSDAIRQALADGGGDLKKARSAMWKKDLKGSVQVMPPMVPIKPQKWTVDSRRGVNPSTKGAVMLHRPRFDNWSMSGRLIVTNDEIPASVVKEALARGGIRIGIGDNRVNGYGRFSVKKFEKE